MALALICVLVATIVAASPQHGNAPAPTGHPMDTWTGEVTSTNDETREITLTYKDALHSRTEMFVGVLPEGFELPLQQEGEEKVKPSKFPNGTCLTVYYRRRRRRSTETK